MFHGHGASKSSLLNDAVQLHELGYTTVLIDFPGYGGSPGTMTTIGYSEADAVAAAWDWNRTKLGPTVLHGVSMGAAAIMRAVSLGRVAPDAVILEAPFDRLLSTVGHRFEIMGLPSFPFAELLLFWGGRIAGMNSFAHNPVDYARNIHCPVLLLAGDKDRYVLPRETQGIFAALNTPKALHFFSGLSHQDFAKIRPLEWREQVSGFLTNNLPHG